MRSKIGRKFGASLQMFYSPDSCVEICLTKDLPYWYLLWSGEPGLAGHPPKRLSVWFQMNHALKVSIFLCLCYRRSSGQPAHKQNRYPHCKNLQLHEIQTSLKHQQCLQITILPSVSNVQRQRLYFISVLLWERASGNFVLDRESCEEVKNSAAKSVPSRKNSSTRRRNTIILLLLW